MKKLFLILLAVFSCLSPALAQTSETDNLDNQFWNETQLVFPLVKEEDESGETIDKLSLFVNGNLRFGRNISRLTDKKSDSGSITSLINTFLLRRVTFISLNGRRRTRKNTKAV